MSFAELLAQPHLSIITQSADAELAKIHNIIEHKALVDGRAELELLLGNLLACEAPITPKTLDLIGHSTTGNSLLMIGDWVIDAAKPAVTAFFRGLADHDVLPRLGVQAVRLLGCLTADTGHARWTLCALADILGIEVFGTKDLIFSLHYDRGGFSHERRYVLVSSRELDSEMIASRSLTRGQAYPRVLDVDALPSEPLACAPGRWPVKVSDHEQARTLLGLVRRRDGATMVGLLAEPSCEIALPSALPDRYHRAQVLLDCEFVRVYPDGTDHPGVIFPVEDPYALRLLVERLPGANYSA